MFYVFRQNNSGGTYYEADGIGHFVIIQAGDENKADERAKSFGMFNLPYCDCCGGRFGGSEEFSSLKKALKYIKTYNDKNASIYLHRKAGYIVEKL